MTYRTLSLMLVCALTCVIGVTPSPAVLMRVAIGLAVGGAVSRWT